MEIVTLLQANNNLNKYIGVELSDFAKDFGITIVSQNGGYNKGWKGQVLERLAGLTNNNDKAPNGLGFEIKSTAFEYSKNDFRARETMAISMLNVKELMVDDFYESHFWQKLKTILFCAVSWDGKFATTGKLLSINTFQTLNDSLIIDQLKADYELIQKYFRECSENKTDPHTVNGVLVQVRTKGSKNSNSRAFYAHKEFVNLIFKNI
jgi:DNA mismatch repair protein MutH